MQKSGELVIIEIQNIHELTYFHRMLYGVSKVITDYIKIGDDYGKVRKVYSVNIVYFSIGQGTDYVYHDKTMSHGLHDSNDVQRLSKRQQEAFFGIVDDGMRKGRAEGEAIGLEKGEAIGVEKGKKIEKLETARNLKSLGVPIETIATATGLSTDEINSL